MISFASGPFAQTDTSGWLLLSVPGNVRNASGIAPIVVGVVSRSNIGRCSRIVSCHLALTRVSFQVLESEICGDSAGSTKFPRPDHIEQRTDDRHRAAHCPRHFAERRVNHYSHAGTQPELAQLATQ